MPCMGAAVVRGGHLGPGLCLLWGGVIWKQGGSPSPLGATLSRGPWPGLNAQGLLCVSAARPASSPCSPPRPPPPELGRGREQAERWPDTVDPRRVPEPQGQRGLRLVVRGPWVCLAGHRGMASVKGVEPEGLGVKPSLIVTWGVSVAGARTRGLKAPSPRAGHLRIPCAPSYSACCLRGPAGAVVASVLPRCVLSASEA